MVLGRYRVPWNNVDGCDGKFWGLGINVLLAGFGMDGWMDLKWH